MAFKLLDEVLSSPPSATDAPRSSVGLPQAAAPPAAPSSDTTTSHFKLLSDINPEPPPPQAQDTTTPQRGPVDYNDPERKPFLSSLSGLGHTLYTSVPFAAKGMTVGVSPEETRAYLEKQHQAEAKSEQMLPGGPAPLESIKDVGSALNFLKENIEASAPQMALTAAGGLGAKAMGGGEIAEGAAGSATGAPAYLGQNIEYASRGGTVAPTREQMLRSALVAPVQSLGDVLEARNVPFVGKIFRPAEKMAVRGARPLLKRMGLGSVEGGTTEAFVEPVQDLLQRWAAGDPLFSPDAIEQYKRSAATAGVVGAAMGGVTGAVHGQHKTSFDPEKQTGDATPNDHTAVQPASSEGQVPQARTQGLFDTDTILDNGIAPTETGGRSQQISRQGAVGKYQLLTKTAKQVAERLGIPFDEDRLLNDDGYNRTLAQAHLDTLRKHYNGDMLLAVTAYHAGQGNVDRWKSEYNYDPSDPQAFLDQVGEHNPLSARYPRSVMAHMGGDLNTVGEDGAQVAEQPEGPNPTHETADLDLTPDAIRQHLRANADDSIKAHPLVATLAKAISAGDSNATDVIATERETLQQKLEKMVAEDQAIGEGGGMGEGQAATAKIRIGKQLVSLQAQEKLIDLAEQTARRAARQRVNEAGGGVQQDLFDQGAYPARGLPPTPQAPVAGVPAPEAIPGRPPINLITEPANPNAGYPVGRRAPFPAETMNPGSGGLVTTPAATTVLAEREQRAAAEDHRVGAENTARANILKDVLTDKTTHSPMERFQARLKRAGLSPLLTAQEEHDVHAHKLLQLSRGVNPMAAMAEEATVPHEQGPLRPDLVAQEAAQAAERQTQETQRQARLEAADREQAALPQQDTTLGVKERPAAVEPAPQVREKTVAENIGDRVQEHTEKLREANPRQSAWFEKGAHTAMGDGTVEAPTGKSQLAWFTQGQDFVRSEQDRQRVEAERHAGREARPERRAEERSARDKAIEAGKARQAARAAQLAPTTPAPATQGPPRPTSKQLTAERAKAHADRLAAAKKAAEERRAARRTPAQQAKAAAREKAQVEAQVKKATPQPAAAEKAINAKKKATPATSTMEKLRAAVAKKEAETDTATKARDAFLKTVDDEVGKTITAQQAQQLNMAEDLHENLGKESAPKFSVKELHEMLATAQAERARAAPKRSVASVREEVRAVRSLQSWHKSLRAELDRRGLHNVRLITSTIEALSKYGEGTEGAYHEKAEGLHRLIEIAHNADNPLTTMSHEIVHALRDMGVIRPHEWEALTNFAKSDPHLMKWAEDNYGDLSEHERMEEAVAQMFAEWATVHSDRAGLPFAKRMMGRVRDFFVAFHQSLTRAGYKDAQSVMRDIESGAIGRRFQGDTVEAAGRGEVKRSYAGEKALTANLKAREDALAAHDKELGRQTFGWHWDAADHLMKFEVDDSLAKLKKAFADWPLTSSLGQAPPLKLGDVLHHAELFAAYPQLKDVSITKRPAFLDIHRLTQGWFNEKTNTINITPYAIDPEATLIHEIQHAIQGIEGFARGGSPESMKLTDKANLGKLRQYYERKADEAHQTKTTQVPGTQLGYMPDFEGKLARLGEIQAENSPVAKALDNVARLEEKVWDAETAVKDTQKQQADDHSAKLQAYIAKYDQLSKDLYHANEQSLQAPKEDRPGWVQKANALRDERSATRSPVRDYDGEREIMAKLRDGVKQAKGELELAKSNFKQNHGDFSDMQHDLYQLLAGETEARDTQERRLLSADQRRLTVPGSHEGVRASEQIVRRTAPGDARATKRSVKREDQPPRDMSKKAVEDRTAVRKGAAALDTTATNLAKNGSIWMAQTRDIADTYKKYMPSLDKWVALNRQSHALGHEFELRLAEVKDEYEKQPQKLKGTGPGTMNDFIEDSTLKGEWGFQPGYHTQVTIDPALEKRFKALPTSAQNVIKAVFRFGFDQHNAMMNTMGGAVNAQFDPAIQEAEAKGDAAEVKQLQAEKQAALADISRLFDTRDGVPYAPMQRQGMFAVIGSSDAYRAAKKEGDGKRMAELRKDPNHYRVNFKDTAPGAEALAHEFKTKFGEQGGTWFERGTDEGHAAISPREMSFYLTRMEGLLENSVDKEGVAAKAMSRLNRDLFLLNLSEYSARKSELGREGISAKSPVTGKGLDMMKAFVTHGRATSNLIGSLTNNVEMQKTILQIKGEVSALEGKERTDGQRAFNEVMTRYAANLGVRPGRLVDKAMRATSIYTLLTNPMYYLTQGVQTVLYTQPILASVHGLPKTVYHLGRAYRDFFDFTKDLSPLGRVDFGKAPEDVRPLLKFLNENDHLNAGYANELGSWQVNGLGVFGSSWNLVDRFLRLMPQRVEVMNRTVAGMAAYRLAREKGQSEQQAMDYAGRTIDDTHGDYSGFNSPTPFRKGGDIAKIPLQFRKFQLISLRLVVQEFKRMFTGATTQEKLQGAQALAFLGAHMAAVGGIVGLPAADFFGTVIMAAIKQATGDDKDWDDWKHELRKKLHAGGDEKHRDVMGDILYKGAPYALLNLDMSDRLGMGNIASLGQYSGVEQMFDSQSKFFEVAGKLILGPSGSVVAKAINGWGYGVEQDDWSRFAQALMPAGPSNVWKAARLKTEGYKAKQGETLIDPDKISWADAAMIAMGGVTREMANQAEQAGDVYDVKEHYKRISTRLEGQFTRAQAAGDNAAKADARAQWVEMQASMRREKLRPLPMSNLYSAPFEANKRQHAVVGTVETTRATRQFVEQMMTADEDEEP